MGATRGRSGLSLIELLVVVAIVGGLAGLVLVAVQASRESARRVACQANLRQIGQAVLGHESARGVLPGLYNGEFLPMPRSGIDEFHFHSWRTAILPGIEQSNVLGMLDMGAPSTAAANQTAVNVTISLFLCPSSHPSNATVPELFEWNDGAFPVASAGTAARNDYEVVGGVQVAPQTNSSADLSIIRFGAWGEPTYDVKTGVALRYRTARLSDISDGLSSTMLVGERAGRPDFYCKGMPVDSYPYDGSSGGGDHHQAAWAVSTHFRWTVMNQGQTVNQHNKTGLFSFHPGGANAAFADGSVRFLKESAAPEVLKAMATRSGSEVEGQE